MSAAATVEKPNHHAPAESSSVSSPSLTESLIDVNKTYTNLTQHSFAPHYSRSLGSPVSKRASSEKGVFSISVECIGTKHDKLPCICCLPLVSSFSFILAPTPCRRESQATHGTQTGISNFSAQFTAPSRPRKK